MDKSVNELYVFGNYYEQMLRTKHTETQRNTREQKLLTHKVNVYYHKYYDYYYDVLAVNVYKQERPASGLRKIWKLRVPSTTSNVKLG